MVRVVCRVVCVSCVVCVVCVVCSSQLAMESLVEEFHARSIGLFLVRLSPDLRVRFERSGLVAKLGSDHLCLTNALAIQAAIDWRRQMEKNAAHELP